MLEEIMSNKGKDDFFLELIASVIKLVKEIIIVMNCTLQGRIVLYSQQKK